VSGDELDDAIDEVVRDIMRAEPPAGLRQRVFRRLSEPERRPFFRAPVLALVGALTLCLAVGALIVRRSQPAPAGPVGSVQVASAPGPARQMDPATVTTARSGRPAAIATRRPPSAALVKPHNAREPDEGMVLATSLADADNTVVIAPLDAIRKIETEPMGAEVVQIDQITVAPLQMERVRVDPLSSPPR
jgi:hypothetical protein